MKFTGKVIREPFGPGHYVLETDDGRVFGLSGGDAGLFVEGQAVIVEGTLRDDLVSVGMTAQQALQVTSYRVV